MKMDEDSDGTLEKDRLSSLPDAVLCHVLSFLPPKYSALSTRWKYLFTSVPIIHCDDHLHSPNNKTTLRQNTFIDFLTRTLRLVTNQLSHVTALCIRNDRDYFPVSLVCSWILTALKYNVKEIEFCSGRMESGQLPREVFASQTLVDLKLNVEFVVSVPECVCLPNLNTLVLGHYVSIDEGSLRKVLSGCPVLETLYVLCRMENVETVEISVPSLHYLSLNVCGSKDHRILLNALNLETICCASYALKGYSGVSSSEMKFASINFSLNTEEETNETKVCELLKLVCETRFLFIDGDVLEGLVSSHCSIPMFDNLTFLELRNNFLVGWEILPALLEASPRLAVLVLEWGILDDNVYRTGFTFSEPESVPECLSLSLEKVVFKIFLGEEPEYEFIEYLLRNGEVLKEIFVRKESCIDSDVELSDLDEEIQSEMEEYFEIGKKLLSFPRRSKACQIVFDAVPMTRDAFIDMKHK